MKNKAGKKKENRSEKEVKSFFFAKAKFDLCASALAHSGLSLFFFVTIRVIIPGLAAAQALFISAMTSEPTSPTLSDTTSSRFSWNPYTGGHGVQHWFASTAASQTLHRLHSPPATDLPPAYRMVLSDGGTMSASDDGELSTPRRRGDCQQQVPSPTTTQNSFRRPSLETYADAADGEAREAIERLRKVKRDENVPPQYKRFNKGMQRRIADAIADDNDLLLDLCESDRGNIVVTIVECCSDSVCSAPAPAAGHSDVDSTASSSPHINKDEVRQLSGSPKAKASAASTKAAAAHAHHLKCLTAAAERILSATLHWAWRLCTSQGGCIAVTRLFDVMPPRQRCLLEDFVVDNFLALSVHPYGNYVVQRVLQHGCGDDSVLRSVLIHVSVPTSVIAVASNKFGSHVLETFFKVASPALCCVALQRLLVDTDTTRFLVNDRFGNYVIQQGMRRVSAAVAGMSPSSSSGYAAHSVDPSSFGSAVSHEGIATQLSFSLLLPDNSELPAMHKTFVALLAPFLSESAYGQNIVKACSPRLSPMQCPMEENSNSELTCRGC